jgi:hypothetical protein
MSNKHIDTIQEGSSEHHFVFRLDGELIGSCSWDKHQDLFVGGFHDTRLYKKNFYRKNPEDIAYEMMKVIGNIITPSIICTK